MKLTMRLVLVTLGLISQTSFGIDCPFIQQDEVKIIVADFGGSGRGHGNPSEWILLNLNDLLAGYDNISVSALSRPLSSVEDPEGDAESLLSSENATMVIWGNYRIIGDEYSVNPSYATPLQFLASGVTSVMTGSGTIRPSTYVSSLDDILELEYTSTEADVIPGGVWRSMAQTYLGIALNTVGRFSEGSVLLEQAIAASHYGWVNSEGYLMALFNGGLSQMALDNLERSIEINTELININPELGACFQNRGCSYYSQRNYDESIDDFTRVLEIDSENADIIFMRGLAYCRSARQNQGILDLNRFLELFPDDALTLGNRGYAYYELEMFDEAIRDLSRAVELQEQPATTHSIANLGLAYMGNGQYENAIECFDSALEMDVNSGTAAIILHNRGDCYCWMNNLDRGIEDFNQVLLLEPNRITTLTIRGRAYLFTNQIANAMADFNRTIELDSNWFPAYYWRGRTYQKSGNNQAAEEDYTLVIERADYDEIRTVALESLESLHY